MNSVRRKVGNPSEFLLSRKFLMKIKRNASVLVVYLSFSLLCLATIGCDDGGAIEEELTIDPVAEVDGEQFHDEMPAVENERLGERTVSDVNMMGEVESD